MRRTNIRALAHFNLRSATRAQQNGMAAPSDLHLTSRDANNSDYGSDIDPHSFADSEYGSDFDVEEETLIRNLLTRLATNAPVTTAIAVEEVEAVATARRGDRSASLEIECDSALGGFWTGITPFQCKTIMFSTDILTASSTTCCVCPSSTRRREACTGSCAPRQRAGHSFPPRTLPDKT